MHCNLLDETSEKNMSQGALWIGPTKDKKKKISFYAKFVCHRFYCLWWLVALHLYCWRKVIHKRGTWCCLLLLFYRSTSFWSYYYSNNLFDRKFYGALFKKSNHLRGNKYQSWITYRNIGWSQSLRHFREVWYKTCTRSTRLKWWLIV